MNHTSLFSDRGMRLVDSYTGPTEPPSNSDDLRDEAIEQMCEDIWVNAADIEDACEYDGLTLSRALIQMLIPIRARMGALPASEDDDNRRVLRELIYCIDREVYKAAERWVDDFDGSDYTGDAA